MAHYRPAIPCDVSRSGWRLEHPAVANARHLESILFGKQQLGFSVVHWGWSAASKPHENKHVARRGPRTPLFLLQTLNEMQMQPQEQQTARLIVASP